MTIWARRDIFGTLAALGGIATLAGDFIQGVAVVPA